MTCAGMTASAPAQKHANVETARFFNQDEYSDLTIKLSDREIRVHKLILSSKCKAFKDLIDNPESYKASRSNEGNVITFKAEDPDAMEALLCFLYSNDYLPDSAIGERLGPQPWERHFNIALVANRFDVEDLKARAVKAFNECVLKIPYGVYVMNVLDKHACYSGVVEELDQAIRNLIDARFVLLFDVPAFRELQDQNIERRNCLFDKHFPALLGKPNFRRMLEEDGKLALRILDLSPHEVGLEEKRLGVCVVCGQPRVEDTSWPARLDDLGMEPTCNRWYGQGRSREQCGAKMKINKCWVKQD